MPAKHTSYERLLPLAAVTGDGAWSPSVDIRELPDKYIVLADMPGVEPETVEVSSEKDTLTIAGARRDRLRTAGVPFRLERPTGRLRRSIRLPGPYDRSNISTHVRDGVLEIRILKEIPPDRA